MVNNKQAAQSFRGFSILQKKTHSLNSTENMALIHAEVNDFVRKDVHLVRVMKVDVSEGCYFTSDGGLIGFDEVDEDNVFLESEVYDELDGHLPDAVDVSE